MKTTTTILLAPVLCAAFLAASGCARRESGDAGAPGSTPQASAAASAATPEAAAPAARAVAQIEPRSGSKAAGTASFTQVAGKVTMVVEIHDAEPGTHAVHLHEKGDCSAPDAASAGGHWNPTSENHGRWGTHPFHHGDIGNLEVGPDGRGIFTLDSDIWTIGGDPGTDVVGKAVVVHAKADDFTTQPTGNAGGRIGCGVISRG